MANDVNYLKKKQRDFSSRNRLNLKRSVIIKNEYFKELLIKFDWFKKSEVIASFISIKSEISTNFLNIFIQESKKILCLPVIEDDSEALVFRKYLQGEVLINGKFNIKEPLKTKIYLPDIIFTPCLAFDNFGFRLGYGGGYYDKTISYLNTVNHKFKTVGLAYDDQKIDEVAHDSLDQKLNYILTEKQLYKIL
jgi:5-formyltetrahydrofolate cyclo-ligase